MRIKNCIFCGNDSSSSKSVEHIIPESLGNKDCFLERGVVCDACNNYFARKIEEKILNLEGFKLARFYSLITNKKGKIPTGDALICGDKTTLRWIEANGEKALLLEVSPETCAKILNNPPKLFFTKKESFSDIQNNEDDKYNMSRFLAKMAIEYYVYLIINESNDGEELTINFDEELKRIADFVRYGRSDKKYLEYTIQKIETQDDYVVSLKFSFESNDLICKFQIMDTIFSMNLSSNSGLK